MRLVAGLLAVALPIAGCGPAQSSFGSTPSGGAQSAAASADPTPVPTYDPETFETNVPGIFCAGDARYGSGKRVAAAVGEGSATVSMVHQYLQTV